MDNKTLEYYKYIHSHTNCVKKAFDWLYEELPELFEGFDSDYLGRLISKHDGSKHSPEEFDAYCDYFYGDEKTDDVKQAFDYAWLHHQHNNPHHWQHWLLREDDGGLKALEMPKEYVIEMVCDHWAFSWKKYDLYEIFTWYKENKSKMVLHENTQELYESILDKIKDRLDDINGK